MRESVQAYTTGMPGAGMSYTMYYYYDDAGVASVMYNGTRYYYAKNLQGDVIGLVNGSGNYVVQYSYDAWGNIVSTSGTLASTLGQYNPFRYRSYYYDVETGFYYLQSRYYDPTVGRFLNADAYVSTGQGFTGNNMFAYCLNNPNDYIDPTGTLAFPGEIHDQVVRRISNRYGFHREQKINYLNFGYGRADLISPDGQVWDVKRDKVRQIKAGEKQVKKYVRNIWRRHPDVKLKVGGSEIEEGFFYYESGFTTYKVTYRNAGNGVIAYDYRITEYDTEQLEDAAVKIGTAVLIGAIAYAIAGLPGVAATLVPA